MRVVHHAKDVPEGINHRSGHKSMTPVLRCLKLRGSHCDSTFQHGMHVINVPVDDDTGSPGCTVRARHIVAINHTQFMLVITEPKLAVAWSFKIRLDTQEVGVPRPRSRMICCAKTDGTQSAQRLWCCHTTLLRYVSLMSIAFLATSRRQRITYR